MTQQEYDPYEVDIGEDVTPGGQFIQEPGWYQFVVTAVTRTPTDRHGTPVQNAMFEIMCECVASSVGGMVEKTKDFIIFVPKDANKTKTRDRWLIALGFVDPSAKGQKARFVPEDAVARQFVCELSIDEEGKYCNLAYSNVFHPLDPSIKHHAWLNKSWLNQLPKAQQTPPNFSNAKPGVGAADSGAPPTANPAVDMGSL